MKILFFIDVLTAGGKERRLTELMKALILKPNIEFELVVMSNEIHYQEVFNLGIKIHYLIRSTKKDILVFNKFYKICKKYKPDIVHCWDSMTAVISVPACVLLNIKFANGMVVDAPVIRNFSNKIWLRAKLTFPFSSIVIGNSNAGLEAYKAPPKKSFCIYNGMNFSRFDNLKEPACVRKEIFGNESDDSFIVGMVAAFEERKDYKTLIKAAKMLISNYDSIRFVLIGDGTDFNEIKNSVSSKLLNRIIFLGKRSDVESLVNIFDVGILLTNSKVHGEGISNSILEYMALKKSVIATSGGGNNEIVKNNFTGYLVSPSNPEELVRKLEILFNDKNLRIKMGFKGRERIIEEFSIDKMVNKYSDLYEMVLTKKSFY